MRLAAPYVVALCVTALAAAPALALTTEETAIKKVLDDSAQAWNRGDIKGFVAISYERSPGTVYLTAQGPVMGYDAIEAVYLQKWAGRAGGSGKLSTENLRFKSLSPDYAIVYGDYRLVFDGAAKPAMGAFDLVFHKSDQGWRVVSDHTG
jgi:ketosteroid isomerase-like protein